VGETFAATLSKLISLNFQFKLFKIQVNKLVQSTQRTDFSKIGKTFSAYALTSANASLRNLSVFPKENKLHIYVHNRK
jgi:hypothetical protein